MQHPKLFLSPWRIVVPALLAALAACSSLDMSSGHLRNGVPRFTAFTTEPPAAIAACIGQRWVAAGHPALSQQKTDTGFALQTTQKFDIQQKMFMAYIAIDTSREGSSVHFYSNHADDMVERSLVNTIQACY